MADAIIATVTAIEGTAYARSEEGELRELRVGDKLRQGETLVTPEGSEVELELADGQTIAIADIPEVALDADMLAEAAATAEEAALQDATLDEVIAAIEGDGDLSELLEAPAAGGTDNNAGSSFIRLSRITEDTPEFEALREFSAAEPDLTVDQGEGIPGADAIDDVAETQQGSPITVPVLANDDLVEGAIITAVSDPGNGTAAINPDGTVTYTPNADFSGADSFTYTVVTPDGNATDTASVSVNVIADAPPPPPPPPPAPLPEVSVGDATVTEGGTAQVNLTLSAPSDQPVTVAINSSDGTATLAGGDYDEVSGTVTFAPGETVATVSVTTNADTLQEGTESLNLTLSNPANAVLGDSQGVVEIVDNFTPTISIDDVTVTEGNAAVLTLTLSAAVDSPVSVGFATADGSAISGADYQPNSGTVTFAPGQTSTTVTVQTNADDIEEELENGLVRLSNPEGATIADPEGVFSIVDGTEPPPPPPPEPPPPPPPPLPTATLSIAPVAGDDVISVGEVDGVISLTVTGSVGADVQAGDPISIVFGDGSTFDTVVNPDGVSYTVTVPVETILTNDTVTGTVSGQDEFGQPYSATASRDYEIDIPQQVISITDETEVEGTDLVFGVELSPLSAYADAGTHSLALTDITTSPGDYGAVSFSDGVTDNGDGTITIPAGVTAFSLTVAGAADEIREDDETFEVNIDGVEGATGTGTILDDDTDPAITVDDVTVNEADGTLTFTLTKTGTTALESSVDYVINPGTATTPADYGASDALSGTITFAADETSRTVTVAIVDDAIDEADEQFTIDLSNPVNATTEARGVGTIVDNDDAPTLSISDVTVNEGETATFTVTLTGQTDSEVSVGLGTADGTAVALTNGAGDYDAETGTLTFPVDPAATSRTLTFEVATNDDAIDEPDETFAVNLSAPSNATIADGEGVGTIVDNDDAPTLSISDVTVNEGETASFTVTLTGQTDGEVTVDLGTADGTAVALTDGAGDYDAATGTLTFAADPAAASRTLTFEVATNEDSALEPDETFTVDLSNASGATIADAQGVGTIVDNDDAPTIAVNDVTVNEADGTLTFTLTKTGETALDGSVDYVINPGTATTPADYGSSDPLSGTVAFAAGETSKTVTVAIVDDSIDELDEQFTIDLDNAVNLSIADAQGVGTIVDNDDAPTLSISDVTVNEGETATFTVTLTGQTDSEVSVDLGTADGTAVALADGAGDYDAETGTLTFPVDPAATSRTLTFDVVTNDDATLEPNETFTVTLSEPANAVIADGEGVGTIVDNDGAPQVIVDDVTVNEADGTLTFTLTKTGETALDGSVDYVINPGTATTPADYGSSDPLSGTVTFAAGETSKTVTVAIVDDTIDEPDEEFTIDLANPLNLTIADAQGVGTIVDNDDAPTLSISDVTVNEGETATFTVTLTGQTDSEVSVGLGTADGTAVALTNGAGDYDAETGTLTFPVDPAATSRTLTFDVVTNDDATLEPNETFTVTLSEPANAVIADGEAVGTIVDNDGAPQVIVDDVTVNEADGTLTFTLTKTGETALDGSVDYVINPGTATTPADYGSSDPLSGTVTFAAGETSKTVTVAIVDDTIDEPDEEFTIDLANPLNLTIADAQGVGTIVDNDDAPTLSISDVTVNEGETATFTVTLTGQTDSEVSVGLGTADGTAVALTNGAGDYDAETGTLTFPVDPAATSRTLTFEVATNDDAIDEPDETFAVNLSAPSNATIADGEGVGTIVDNDDAPTLSISDVTVNEGETASFTVTLTGQTDGEVTVDLGTADGTAVALTDGAGDYDAATGTLTFAADPAAASRTLTFEVATNEDSALEPDETFTVDLSNASGATIADTQGVGTIVDNDDAPTIAVNDVTVNEADGTLTFTLTKTGETALDGSVDYVINPGTATTPADYGSSDPLSGTVAFAAGETSKTVTVAIVDDSIDELDEQFTIDLANPVNLDIADGEGVGTILDDDEAPQLSISDVAVPEGDTASFTVTLNGQTDREVSVDLVTADGTAVALAAGQGDYDAATGTLTFAADPAAASRTLTFDVVTNDDATLEPNETFTVTLSEPANAVIADGEGVGTIVDNDGAPQVIVDDVTVNEADGTLTFTLTKTGETALDGSVDYVINPGTATTPADYGSSDPLSGTVAFAAGEASKTVTVAIVDDSIDELDEQFTIDLDNAVNLSIADAQGVGTILDNDDAPTLSIDDVTVDEGGLATFTVTLTGQTDREVTVDLGTADGSAVALTDGNGDYDDESGTLTFPADPAAASRTLSFSVQTNEDAINELDETFTVNLSNADNATIADAQGVGTILDNDNPPTIAVDDVTVNEGDGTLTFTLTKTGETALDGSVDYTINPGTATTPADYGSSDPLSGTVAFAAGETSKTVTVAIVDDSIDELDEQFTIDLDNAVNLSIADNQGIGTILDNDEAPTLSISDVTVNEGETAAFTVTLNGQTDREVSVDLNTADGTAIALAAGQGDYDADTGTLTFPVDPAATSRTLTFSVVTNDDAIDENDETFTVNLSAPANATIADGEGVGTILDNDDPPTIAVDDVTVNEADGTLTFTLTKTGETALDGSVDYVINPGTATTPADYGSSDPLSGTVAFAAGETSKTVTVAIVDDTIDEPDEEFTIDLANPLNLTIADAQGVGTIVDNDDAPTLSISDVTVAEGDTATFTVTLTGQTDRAVSVDLSTSDGTAIALATGAGDYDAATGTLTFAVDPAATSRTLTFDVLTNQDALNELDEIFTVNLTNASNAGIDDGEGIGTIIDADLPTANDAEAATEDETLGSDSGSLAFELGTDSAVSFGAVYDGGLGAATQSSSGGVTTIASDAGVWTLTINETTGAYTFSQLAPYAHDIGADSDSAGVTITLTDAGGNAVNATLSLSIGDDEPTATALASSDVDEGATVTGTLSFAGGADGATVTAIGSTALIFGQDGYSQAIDIGSGSIKVMADGSYSFTAENPAAGPASTTFTVTDSDGDTATAAIAFNVVDANTPTASPDLAAVDDEGLSGGIAGGISDDNTTASAIFSDTLPITTGGDTPVTVDFAAMNQAANNTGTIGQESVSYSWASGVLTATITSSPDADRVDETLFTVTVDNAATGAYTVALARNVLHAQGPNNENQTDPTAALAYRVTDNDGSTASSTLTVRFDDDEPTATALASSNVDEGATVTGTLSFAGGADGATVTAIGSTALIFGQDGYSQAIDIGSGSIKVMADGSYSFTAENPAAGPASTTFTVTDSDGDTATAAIAFNVVDANTPTASPDLAAVDDEGLSGGIAGGISDDNTTASATFSDTLPITTGGDTPVTVDFAAMNQAANNTGTIGQESVSYSWASGVLTATITSSPDADRVDETLFTVTVDNAATGAYTVALARNVLHAQGPNNENQTDPTAALAYRVTDNDGSTASSTLTVRFDDDEPTATALASSNVDEGATVTGTLSFAGGADGATVTAIGSTALIFGQDGYSQAIDIGSGSIKVMADGSYSFTAENPAAGPASTTFTVTDSDGDTATADIDFNVVDANVPTAGESSAAVDDDGLTGGNPASTVGDLDTDAGDTGAGLGDETIFVGTLDLSFGGDGAGSVDFGDMDGTAAAVGLENVDLSWNGTSGVLTATIDGGDRDGQDLFTVTVTNASTGAYRVDLLQNVLHAGGPNDEATDATVDLTYTVTDADNSVANPQGTLTVTFDDDAPTATALASSDVNEGTTVTGTLSFAGGADGATVTAIGSTALIFGQDGYSQAIDIGSGSIKVMADGSYSFTAENPAAGPASTTFTVTDSDGDTATAAIAFNVVDANVPTAGESSAAVDDDGLTGGNPASTVGDLDTDAGDTGAGLGDETIFVGTLDLSFGGDGAGSVDFGDMDGTAAAVGLENVDLSWNGTSGVLTATIDGGDRDGQDLFTVTVTNASTGAYRVDLLQNVLHAGGPNDEATDATVDLTFTVTDADNSVANPQGTLTVTFDDDAPTATALASSNVDEGTTVTGTLSFAGGADGATVTAIGSTALIFGQDGYSQAIDIGSGSIRVKADGSYSFTAKDPAAGPASTTFTVTDSDGDTATAAVAFNVVDANTPTAEESSAAVDDDGLTGGNPLSTVGDLDANLNDAETTPDESVFVGTLNLDFGGDGAGSVDFGDMDGTSATVGLENVDLSWNGTSGVLTATIDGGDRDGEDLFTVTVTNASTGAYRVDLLQNVLHAGGPNDEATDATVDLTFTVTDADNSVANPQGTLTVTFDDDAPTATALASSNVDEGTTVTGTLSFAGGADGATVTAIGSTALIFGQDGYSQAIDIGSGSIKVMADGSYSFTAENPAAGPASTTFTVTDSDGDAATADIDFNVVDANVPTAGESSAAVDDDGLTGGNPASTVGDLDTDADDTGAGLGDETIFVGTLDLSFGGDGAGSVDFGDMDGTAATVGLENVDLSWNGTSGVLTATIDGGDRDGQDLFTVTVTNASTGAYRVDLLQNVLHAGGPNDEATDATVDLTFTVTDADNSVANPQGTLTVTFDDDAPTATNDGSLTTVGETATSANVGTVADILGNDSFGADGQGSPGVSIGAGNKGGSISIDGSGNLIYTNTTLDVAAGGSEDETFEYTITDADGDTSSAEFSVTVEGDNAPPLADPVLTKSLTFGDSDTLPGGVTVDNPVLFRSFTVNGIVDDSEEDSVALTNPTAPEPQGQEAKPNLGGEDAESDLTDLVFQIETLPDYGSLYIDKEASGTYTLLEPSDLGEVEAEFKSTAQFYWVADETELDLTTGSVPAGITATQFDGSPGTVTATSRGIGVASSPAGQGQVPEQLGYRDGSSEAIRVDFNGPVTDATIDINRLIRNEGEVGQVEAFCEGELVGRWTFSGDGSHTLLGDPIDFNIGGDRGSFTINGIVFDSLRFTATEYADGFSKPGDSSDYFVEAIAYTALDDADFTYSVRDEDGNQSDIERVVIEADFVKPPPLTDLPPVADADSATTPEDTAVTFSITGNDTDVDGTIDPSTVVITGGPANGNLINNGNGTVTYTPNQDYHGSDSFTYTVEDNDGLVSNEATVSLTVSPDNDPPIAVDDSYSTDEDVDLVITDALNVGVLANDNDLDGDALTVNTTPITDVSNGTLTLNSDGTFTYTPDPDFSGTDSFVYQVNDGNGETAQATVTITVDPANDPPIAVNDSYSTDEGTILTVDGNVLDSVLANDSDLDGDTLTVNTTPITDVSNGTLTLNSDGTFTYTPDPDFNGTDSFVYQVNDGNGETAQATVTITVDPANDPPTILNGSTRVSEEGLPEGLEDTIGNSDETNLKTSSGTLTLNDPDGDSLTVEFTDNLPADGVYKSAGDNVIFTRSNGNQTVTATAGGATVLTATIDNAGNYSTELFGAFDHADASSEDQLSIELGVAVNDATDSSEATLTVIVEDDSPVLTGFTGSPYNAQVGAGSINIPFSAGSAIGADAPGQVTIEQVTTGSGQSVSLTESNGVWTGSVDGVDAFTIALNPNGNGLLFEALSGSEPTLLGFDQSTAFPPTSTKTIGDVTITGTGEVNGSQQGLGAGGNTNFDSNETVNFEFVSPQTDVTIGFETSTDFDIEVDLFLNGQKVNATVNQSPYTQSFDVQGNTTVFYEAPSVEFDRIEVTRTDTNTGSNKITSISYLQAAPPDVYTVINAKLTDEDGDSSQAFQFTVDVTGSAAPIAVDLDGDGVEYLSREAGVVFTDQTSGESVKTAWVNGDDGLLVVDANNSGTVDESREYVFTEWSETAQTDMEAVREVFDTNQDGVLDAQDEAWEQFGVWQDADGDGQTDAGELVALGELGIDSIALNYNDGSEARTEADGDVLVHGQSAVTWTDGSTSIAEDVSFATEAIELRDLVEGLDDGESLEAYLQVSTEGSQTVVEYNSAGAFNGSAGDAAMVEQTFTFEGMDVSGLNDLVAKLLDPGAANPDS